MRVVLFGLGVMLVACGGGNGGGPTPDAAGGDDGPGTPDGPGRRTCTRGGAPGLVNVRAASGTRIIFQDANGAVVDDVVAMNGMASATLPPCGSVTAVKIAAVLTVTDVEPGDTITIGAPHPASADPRQVRIFFPQTGLEGNFEFHAGPAGPSGCAFLVHQSSANFAVPAACRSSTTGNIDLLAFDRTSSPTEEPVQFAAVDVAAPAAGEVAMTTIAAWRTDFQSVPVDIANAPADLTSRRVALSPVRDRKAVGGGFATRTLPASLQLIPYGEHALRSASVASFDDALQIVDVVAQPLAATVFDMATVPYRITAITMTGLPPTATWTTSAAPDADMGIACVFWPDNFEWCAVFDPARPTVPFPSLPDGILPDEAPSQIGLVLRATSVFAGYADARRDSQNPTGSDGVRIPTDLVMHDVVRFPEPFTIWSL